MTYLYITSNTQPLLPSASRLSPRSVQVRQQHASHHRRVRVPLEVAHSRHRQQLQPPGAVQLAQPDRIALVDVALAHRHHVQMAVVVAKVAGLPRRDDAVVGAADQHEATQPQQVVAEARRVVGARLVVDVRQEGAVLQVQLLLVRIVPVVAHGRVLADVRVEQLVGGVRDQAGEDQVQELGCGGEGWDFIKFTIIIHKCLSISPKITT